MSIREVSFEHAGRKVTMRGDVQPELDLDLPEGEIGEALLELQAARKRRLEADAAAMVAEEEQKEAVAAEGSAIDELCKITERCRRD